MLAVLQQTAPYIINLATLEQLDLQLTLPKKPEQAVTAVVQGIEIFLPLKGLIVWRRNCPSAKGSGKGQQGN